MAVPVIPDRPPPPAEVLPVAYAAADWQNLGEQGYDHPAADDLRRHRAALVKRKYDSFGYNVAAIYVDVSGLVEGADPILFKGGRATVLDADALNPEKSRVLGLGEGQSIAVMTTESDFLSQQHSEGKLLELVRKLLRQLGVPVAEIEKEARARTRAVVTERSPCTKVCSRELSRSAPQAQVAALVPHRPGRNADGLMAKWNASVAAAQDRKEQQEKLARSTKVVNEVMAPATGECTAPSRARRRTAVAAGCEDHESSAELARALVSPGGIDFSSLELRYLDFNGDKGEVDFAFHGASPQPGGQNVDGVDEAKQASDAFFVWLALPKSAFWVNLNPDQPDRVMDRAFGRTDAGRVLLEADLELKRTGSRLMDPDTPTGRRFWAGLATTGATCFVSRAWITPEAATVREDGDALYIVDAPLRVQMESDLQGRPGSALDCPQPAAATERFEKIYRTVILPHMVRAVNQAPSFAPLRRVYKSRVAAEWYRAKYGAAGPYAGIVDSGEIGRWQINDWAPRYTFRHYLATLRDPAYKKTITTTSGAVQTIRTYTYGGVDFSAVARSAVSASEFEKGWPTLADAVRRGVEDGSASEGSERWLGGGASVDTAALAREFPPRRPPGRPKADSGQDEDRLRQVAPYAVSALVAGGLLLLAAAVFYSLRGRRAERRRGTLLLVIGAVGLLVLALVLGLLAWLGDDDSGPDYAADCALIEEKGPELGSPLTEMTAQSQQGAGADPGERAGSMEEQAQIFREMADGMTDREMAEAIEDYADASDRIAQATRDRDIGAMTREIPVLSRILRELPPWLDEHCPRWLGPGQWGEPGSTPTAPTGLPTGLPTDFPTGGATGAPTELPSMPSLPSIPSPPEN
ncbi:PT domain-containing protein [Nocardioides speluncae]|uniref:PT domain-containing protein n=1 Tax=Nocardioides speluncae TaxID=2670337 RepID=UPI0012B183FA|nr:PT domain-containing protein [Nocardioides speluncae]